MPGPGGLCGDPHPKTATAAGGTHPTGMYSGITIPFLSRFTKFNKIQSGKVLLGPFTDCQDTFLLLSQ